MGSPFSKSSDPLADVENINNSVELISELRSYESDCLQDPELRSFDSTLQNHAGHVLSTLSAGVDARSLSFDTLREVTGCLLDANQEVVSIILEYKKDIWSNAELFGLVEQYFESSLCVLDFCTVLEKCLKRARDSQLIILVALKRFNEEEEEETSCEEGSTKRSYKTVLKELRHFKAAADPFTGEFFRAFESVYRQQVSMLDKLKERKKKLDKKMKRMRTWRKVSTVIFVSAFAVVLVCSIVVAAVTVPPVIPALAAAAVAAMGPVGKWLNSLWKEYLETLKGQQEVLDIMRVGTYVAISDLDSIRLLVDRLGVRISSLVDNVEVALRQEEEVKFVIEEIKKKLEGFMNSIEDLGKQADRCAREIQKARTVVLQRIIRHPN